MVIGDARAGDTGNTHENPLLDTKLSINQHISLRKRASQSFRFYYRTNIYMLSD